MMRKYIYLIAVFFLLVAVPVQAQQVWGGYPVISSGGLSGGGVVTGNIRFDDDIDLLFGDSSDVSLSYTSATDLFEIVTATNTDISIFTDANRNLFIGDSVYAFGHSPEFGVEGVAEFDALAHFDAGLNAYETINTADGVQRQYGTGSDIRIDYDLNGGGDDILNYTVRVGSANDTGAIFYNRDYNPNGMTAFDNYLSPTLVLANSEGADNLDFNAVVIGARTTADIAVANYFDFFAMTGAADGAVDATTTELAPAFRFGPDGTMTAAGSVGGDVLIERRIAHKPGTIADGDATPDISGAGKFWTTSSNTGATEITDLVNPLVGSEVCIIGGSDTNSSTISDAANFNLSGGWTASLDDMLCLYVQADNDYIEISRVDN